MTAQSDAIEPQDFNGAFEKFSQVDKAVEKAGVQPGASGEVAVEPPSEPIEPPSGPIEPPSEPAATTSSEDDVKTLIEGLRSQITKLEQGQQIQKEADKKQPDDSPSENELGFMQGEGWESLKKGSPEVANIIEAQKKQIDLLSEQVKAVSDQSAQQYHAQQTSLMDKAVPEWRKVIAKDDFTKWMQGQPEQVRQMIDSPKADEVSWLIGLYKTQTVTDIKEKRQQAAQAAVEIPTKNSGAKPSGSLPEDNFEAAFDYYSKQG